MKLIERLGLAALHRLDPERAHDLSLRVLRMGLMPLPGHLTSERLKTELTGLQLPNPVGLAAGFDKNATALAPLLRAGFGFIEVGAATPRPQPGNPKPRLFRLTEDRAAINRFGFNNDGMEAIGHRLAATGIRAIPIGLNLGANKDSADRASDYVRVLTHCGPHADFVTVNVSSPNTERLRDLQGDKALRSLLQGVMRARDELSRPIPVLLKIAPDLNPDELAAIAGIAEETGISAIIATNTTLARDNLRSPARDEKGGLSGAPLFERSTRILALLSSLTGGRIPLIGVGGISSAEDAYEKILAGASAIQLYTVMVYEGISIIPRIIQGLEALLARDGFENIADATGSRRGEWI